MAQCRINDYLYYEQPYRRVSNRYEITICRSSILYKTVSSIIRDDCQRTKAKQSVSEKFAHHEDENVRILTERILNGNDILLRLIKRNVSYTACIQDDNLNTTKHVCDAHMIMIGCELEKKILNRLSRLLSEENHEKNNNDEVCFKIDERKHEILKGAYISHGCLYYSVFREVNNNTICYEMGMNKEITFYLYDKDFNRGHKFFLKESDENRNVKLLCNNRDGKIIQMTNCDMLSVYYKKCTHEKWHPHIEADPSLQKDYMLRVRDYSRSVDSHKNKRYLCYAQSVQICLDKLNVFEGKVMDSCRQLFMRGITFWGISHTLNYEPSKSEHNKNYNKRMMMIKMNERNDKGLTNSYTLNKRRKLNNGRITTSTTTTDNDQNDEMGSAEHKNGIMYTFQANKENSSSLFVQISHSHFHNLQELQMTAQKLRVKHVYAVSARNVSKDSFGYICCKYIGNIGTAGKNMIFADGVEISYGHEDLVGIRVLDAISRNCGDGNRLFFFYDKTKRNDDDDDDVVIVLNNIITKYAVSLKTLSVQSRTKIIKTIKSAYEFAEIVFWTDKAKKETHRRRRNFICINITPGIPFRKFAGLDKYDLKNVYLSRTELEQFYKSTIRQTNDDDDMDAIIDGTNQFLCELIDRREIECCSMLSKKVGHKTEFTLPPKRAVSVNAYKSSLPNKSFITLARMTHKNVQIFVDPEAFEKDEIKRNGRQTNRFELIRNTFDDNIQGDTSNMYYLNTAFGDIDGMNVEDAYVLDKNVDLHLWCVVSYSLTFEEPEGKIAVLLPSIYRSVCVSLRNAEGEPVQVFVLLATIYSENEINFPVFRNVCVFKTKDKINTYTVYAVISEEILISKIIPCDKEGRPLHTVFCGMSLETERFEYYKPKSKNGPTDSSSVYYRRIDFVAIFKNKHFNGIKIVNSFGQKGLATVDTDLSTTLKTVEGPDDKPGDFVNLVTNNCSLISRCASGQLLQMKQNFPCTVKVDGKQQEQTRGVIGRVPFFFTDNMPSLSTAPMRFDEMQKTTLVANAVPITLNFRSNCNINNVKGLCYPKDSRHVLNLYESIINSSFRMSNFNEQIYTTSDDVNAIVEVYEEYQKNCLVLTKCMKKYISYKT